MSKFYISFVSEGFGSDGNVRVEEYEDYFQCLIGEIKHFSELEDDFDEEDEDEDTLEDRLNSIQSENCGEWMIVSIIEDGVGVKYVY